MFYLLNYLLMVVYLFGSGIFGKKLGLRLVFIMFFIFVVGLFMRMYLLYN